MAAMVAVLVRVNTEQHEHRRRRVEQLLKPGGKPLGVPSRSGSRVRRVSEGPVEAVAMFRSLRAMRRIADLPDYPGRRAEIPGLGYVGLRIVSKSGEPTLDVDVRIDGLRNVKFKYVGRDL